MHRVLDKDGVLVILEPSKPSRFPIKQLYNIYFTYILPLLGKIISKDKNAYKYLTNSVNAFPPKKMFLKKLGLKTIFLTKVNFMNIQPLILNMPTL